VRPQNLEHQLEKIMAMNGEKPKFVLGVLMTAVFLFLGVPLAHGDEATSKLYGSKCAMCHGPDGKGDTPAGKANKIVDLTSADVQKRSDEDLAETITKGKNKMPAYGKSLKPDQISGLVAYIRSLGKKS
jgi:cytochrome c6